MVKKIDAEYIQTFDNEMSKTLIESVLLRNALLDLAESGVSIPSDVLQRSQNLIPMIIRLQELFDPLKACVLRQKKP